jgi:hypothetical protein
MVKNFFDPKVHYGTKIYDLWTVRTFKNRKQKRNALSLNFKKNRTRFNKTPCQIITTPVIPDCPCYKKDTLLKCQFNGDLWNICENCKRKICWDCCVYPTNGYNSDQADEDLSEFSYLNIDYQDNPICNDCIHHHVELIKNF